eukprot:TRINITY_DN64815_c0_g1_i1.p1 TRINITY_DN64815_c0_g1~~TRINITY_DN64815_c0_g1_i1.p1  ORF type:complete len:500 (+),score=72.08 TRINITY_DN64815_c0_g1_i1:109-1608(+)
MRVHKVDLCECVGDSSLWFPRVHLFKHPLARKQVAAAPPSVPHLPQATFTFAEVDESEEDQAERERVRAQKQQDEQEYDDLEYIFDLKTKYTACCDRIKDKQLRAFHTANRLKDKNEAQKLRTAERQEEYTEGQERKLRAFTTALKQKEAQRITDNKRLDKDHRDAEVKCKGLERLLQRRVDDTFWVIKELSRKEQREKERKIRKRALGKEKEGRILLLEREQLQERVAVRRLQQKDWLRLAKARWEQEEALARGPLIAEWQAGIEFYQQKLFQKLDKQKARDKELQDAEAEADAYEARLERKQAAIQFRVHVWELQGEEKHKRQQIQQEFSVWQRRMSRQIKKDHQDIVDSYFELMLQQEKVEGYSRDVIKSQEDKEWDELLQASQLEFEAAALLDKVNLIMMKGRRRRTIEFADNTFDAVNKAHDSKQKAIRRRRAQSVFVKPGGSLFSRKPGATLSPPASPSPKKPTHTKSFHPLKKMSMPIDSDSDEEEGEASEW